MKEIWTESAKFNTSQKTSFKERLVVRPRDSRNMHKYIVKNIRKENFLKELRCQSFKTKSPLKHININTRQKKQWRINYKNPEGVENNITLSKESRLGKSQGHDRKSK